MSCLHEIEKTVYTLWMNSEARAWLLSASPDTERPAVLAGLDPDILSELNNKGARLYARSINYEHQNMADCIFPRCARVIGKDWEQLVARYYDSYPSAHFNFNKICASFPQFLQESCPDLLAKYPYLAELADYEWLELEKSEDEREVIRAPHLEINGVEQVIAYYPLVNQTLTLRHYNYPVADISAKLKNKRISKKFAASPCYMAVYRDPETLLTRCMQLGEATAAIVEKAQSAPRRYQDLLRLGMQISKDRDLEKGMLEYLELIEGLHKDNIFVGSLSFEDRAANVRNSSFRSLPIP